MDETAKPMADASAEAHWQGVYERHDPHQVSWYEPTPDTSLALIASADLPLDAAIIDVGGGASRLAAELVGLGHEDVTVADISAQALERAQAELGEAAAKVTWIVADVRGHDFGRRFDLWHDRAVFHFMVEPADREGYLAVLRRSLRPGGHLILATFGPEGPTECSGLPTNRYDADQLTALLAPDFRLAASQLADHTTPSGSRQQFVYTHFQRI